MLYQTLLRLAALILTGLVFVYSAQSAGLDLSPEEALTKARSGEILLIDIRTPEEWRETGVPAEAHRIDMTDPRFIERLLQTMGGNRSAPIALICRTGNRSGYVQQQLRKLGFSQVYDVPEGVLGNRLGPGWIRRGLPIERCTDC
ncbi:rhodanese-like domain-containing protein [Thermochromatium tepidum]|uniref:Rhodanese-like domain-containing protein n=1 Tax=Thermochromatium tepidum ATCC 43061 TaxID=316276 RepID=A0A6I6EAZ5_THETI|nr:rhodanese-like domain-containing protein [Thermochromatium tepidum]QGU33798.1 rhodanese-like domain-containing protein [Thermochromatium tepidum ATCC 43061]